MYGGSILGEVYCAVLLFLYRKWRRSAEMLSDAVERDGRDEVSV